MHLVHDFKINYAKLGLILAVLFSLNAQVSMAQKRREPPKHKITFKEALPLIQHNDRSWVDARLFRRPSEAEQAKIKEAGLNFIKRMAQFTEVSDFDTQKIVYDPDKEEFIYLGNLDASKSFDLTSALYQPTPFDILWDSENGKFGPDAETKYGLSLNMLNFVQNIVHEERVQLLMMARCDLELEQPRHGTQRPNLAQNPSEDK